MLLVGWLLLLPGSIAIFPAIVAPIWVAMFAVNGPYDAAARRRLGLVLAAGCVVLLIAILAYILVS